MRKIYALMVAIVAICFATEAFAGTKNLYKQDFEAAVTPVDAGWTSPNLAAGMSLTSTEYGKWFTFSLGNSNNRNAVMNFNYGLGADETIFDNQDVKEYTVKFQWGFDKNTNNGGDANNNKNLQYSSEIALLTPSIVTSADVPEGWKITTAINNGQYAANDSLRLFALTQLKGAYADGSAYWIDNTDNSSYINTFYINGDTENRVELTEGMWYDISVTVDTEARTAKYVIDDLEGNHIADGTYNIPSYASVWVKGLNVLLGRYNAVASIDEVKVQSNIDGDYANAPTISMTEIYMAQRTFDIYFEEGEILHVKKTDGSEDTAVESPYHYVTSTSGTLEAWTESGTATSEHITYDVVAEAIALPAASVEIMGVSQGYGKTLQMTVDNTSVPTQPSITLTWEYSNGDKSNGEVASGAQYVASDQGTLTVTTHAYGFQETTTTFVNDTEFAVDNTIDFQHLDEAALAAKGFSEMDALQSATMSGEQNWTARKRLWFGIENGELNADGSAKYDTYAVYGPEGANDGVEPLRRFYLPSSKLTKEVATTIFAPLYTWYTGQADESITDGSDVAALKINYGVGLVNAGAKGDETGAGGTNFVRGDIGIDGLTANDFVIYYLVCDYGTTSAHPIYPAGTSVADGKAMYKESNIGTAISNANQYINGAAAKDGQALVLKGTDILSLYRIDTAIARVEVYKAQGASGIQTLPYNEIVSDHNAPVYNLNGVQVKGALKKGIYVKQGKKFVVR